MNQLLAPEIHDYAESHTQAGAALLNELREYTFANIELPQMQVGRVEGGLLRMLVALIGASRVLEIGTFTGYSALCMAEGLKDGGQIITCEIDSHHAEVAQSFFDRSPHGAKIALRFGDALATLKSLDDIPFDMAFVDADKEGYLSYYEAIVPRLRVGGLLVVDNVLWDGEVVSPESAAAKAIDALNERVLGDQRVDNVLLTVRDGIMLARKR